MIGLTVELKNKGMYTYPIGRENNQTAIVIATLDDYSEGAVKLDRDLCGCRYWNIEDLVLLD